MVHTLLPAAPKPNFPISAVVGHQALKLALTLAAIEPALQGILISGPRGTAKTTLARGFADVIARIQVLSNPESQASFVNLPLGASEEMLVGTLDLQRVLSDQAVSFQSGLFAKAHQGVLYVDEVNLLPDYLVDLLLDVSASGVNRVERDGISHTHPSSFVLLGTMNPEEGMLRPQLEDRFGLSVSLTNSHSLEDRVEIVRLREAFDQNPEGFARDFEAEQAALVAAIITAKKVLPEVKSSEVIRKRIAERCQLAGVEGLRADIIWHRAAKAYAAYCQADQVNEQHLDAVEALVLAHRRREPSEPLSPPPPPSSNFKRPDGPAKNQNPEAVSNSKPLKAINSESLKTMQKPDSNAANSQETANEEETNSTQGHAEGDWGQMSVQAHSVPMLQQPTSHTFETDTGLGSQRLRAGRRISVKGPTHGESIAGQSIDWFNTLLASFNPLSATRGRPPIRQLVFGKHREYQPVLHLVMLDNSASVVASKALSIAKSWIMHLAETLYLNRQLMTLMTFGNGQLNTVFDQKRPSKDHIKAIAKIAAGGGTPLMQMLNKANLYCKQLIARFGHLSIQGYLVTDGCTLQSARPIDLLNRLCLIDVEQSAVKRGRGPEIAKALQAQYIPIANDFSVLRCSSFSP